MATTTFESNIIEIIFPSLGAAGRQMWDTSNCKKVAEEQMKNERETFRQLKEKHV